MAVLHLVDDVLFDEHESPFGAHPERPERLVAARAAVRDIESRGVEVQRLAPRDASDIEILRVHDAPYVQLLHAAAGKDARLDADTFVSKRSVGAAIRAAGGAVALVDRLLDPALRPDARRGVALLRPPGHHATPSRPMGFCLLNNAAIAAQHALASGVERVAIVDYDVHHGNGTQDAFYSDPRVLYVSLHQAPLYPGTGHVDEVGEGEGVGFTANLPLSAEAGDETYEAAFQRVVLPLLHAFVPSLVLISAGFDAHTRDPLAAMRLTARGYGAMTRGLRQVADATANGRIGLVLEGGYDLEALQNSLRASVAELVSVEVDPIDEIVPARRSVLSRHLDEVARARKRLATFWPDLA